MTLRQRLALWLARTAYRVDARIAEEFFWQLAVRSAAFKAEFDAQVRRMLG